MRLRFAWMLTLSICIAVAAFSGETYLHTADATLVFVGLLPLIWLTLFVAGLFLYRLRGLWILIGLPLAMFWPVLWGAFIWGATHGHYTAP
jgi:hypothetical protein